MLVAKMFVLCPGESVRPLSRERHTSFIQRIRVAHGARTKDVGVEQREHGGEQSEPETDRCDDGEDEAGARRNVRSAYAMS